MKNQMLASCVVLAVSLTACATNPSDLNTDALQKFAASPEKGALIMEVGGTKGCARTNILMRNKSGENVSLALRTSPTVPTVHVVEPGEYSFVYGSCYGQQYSIPNFADLNIWFGPITVAAGETVYPGRLNLKTQDVKIRREGLDALVGTLNLKPNKKRSFATYSFEDLSSTLPERISEDARAFSQTAIHRPPLHILDPVEFEGAIERAYAKTEENKFPTEAEVDARIKSEITTALARSLATVKERNPNFKGTVNN